MAMVVSVTDDSHTHYINHHEATRDDVNSHTQHRIEDLALDVMQDPQQTEEEDPFIQAAKVFASQREELLAGPKYNGLMTRNFLRDERWLEYTLLSVAQVVKDEMTARADLEVEERRCAAPFEVSFLRLEALIVCGTEGTFVGVEEEERVVRYREVHFSQVREWEMLLQHAGHELQKVLVSVSDRLTEERRRRDVIDGSEYCSRYKIEMEEDSTRDHLNETVFRVEALRLFQILLWGAVMSEYNDRVTIEADEIEALQSSNLEAVHSELVLRLKEEGTDQLEEECHLGVQRQEETTSSAIQQRCSGDNVEVDPGQENETYGRNHDEVQIYGHVFNTQMLRQCSTASTPLTTHHVTPSEHDAPAIQQDEFETRNEERMVSALHVEGEEEDEVDEELEREVRDLWQAR